MNNLSLYPETMKSLILYRERLLSLPYNDKASRLVDILTMFFEAEQEAGDAK